MFPTLYFFLSFHTIDECNADTEIKNTDKYLQYSSHIGEIHRSKISMKVRFSQKKIGRPQINTFFKRFHWLKSDYIQTNL